MKRNFISDFENYTKFMSGHKFKEFNQLVDAVNEGLIKTHDVHYVINQIQMKMSKQKIKIDVIQKGVSNAFVVVISDFNYIDLLYLKLSMLEEITVNIGGYFPARYEFKFVSGATEKNIIWTDNTWDNLVKNSSYYNEVKITFESKFDDIYQTESKFLYHITNKKYLDKILRLGLIPKHKNKFSAHPDRIYLTDTIEDAENIKDHMWMDAAFRNYDIEDKRAKLTNEYVILKIDTNLIPKTIFRKDVNYDEGFYITTNIPPSALSIEKEIK